MFEVCQAGVGDGGPREPEPPQSGKSGKVSQFVVGHREVDQIKSFQIGQGLDVAQGGCCELGPGVQVEPAQSRKSLDL